VARLLLIDDSKWWLKRIKTMLESYGHTVLSADLVSKGIDIAGKEKIDCIITDLLLPDGTGFDVLKALSSNFPIIVLTADFQEETIQECRKNGAKDVIQKELVKKFLKKSIENVLGELKK